MLPTDTPRPFAEAYQRLSEAQTANSLVSPEERAARDRIADKASERARIKRRLPKPF